MVLWKVYGKARRRHHGGLPRLRFAQGVSKAQVIAKLLVGFSDDRRFFVQLLVLLVFFVLVIIIVGMSRRHRVTAHDGDETPNVLGDPWSHFRLLCGCRVHGDVSARARARQSVCIAVLQCRPLYSSSFDRSCPEGPHRFAKAGLAFSPDEIGLTLKTRRCSRFASKRGSVFPPASLSLSMMS